MKLPVFWTSTGLRSVSSLSTAQAKSGVIGPAVRLLLYQYNIKETSVKPTGPKGNILKGDVLDLIKTSNLKPVPQLVEPPPAVESAKATGSPKMVPKPGEKFIDIPLTNMRRAIAKRLLMSKQTIPHAYVSASVNITSLDAIRAEFKKEGYKVSINDLLVKAAATALQAVPEVNVRYVNGQIIRQNTIDVSIAVATEAGLITPIIFNANRLGVAKISQTVKQLVAKAKENKLQPAEFEGGTFSISNLGMFGSVSSFTAIINPPQSAILAVGGTRREVGTDGSISSMISVSLCYDSRAITDLDAQRFLDHFKLAINEPECIVAGTSAFYDLAALL